MAAKWLLSGDWHLAGEERLDPLNLRTDLFGHIMVDLEEEYLVLGGTSSVTT